MMKSGSVLNYVISGMVADSIIFLYTVVCFIVIPVIYGFNIPGSYLPALLYIGAEICNIYFLCFFLVRDRGFSTASVIGLLTSESMLTLLVGVLNRYNLVSQNSHKVYRTILIFMSFIP